MKFKAGILALLIGAVLCMQGEQGGSVPVRVEFKQPRPVAYHIHPIQPQHHAPGWLVAAPENAPEEQVEISRRVVVQLESGRELKRLLAGRPGRLARVVTETVFILELPDAHAAVEEAQRLAAMPHVMASYPVMRRAAEQHGPYGPLPNDMYVAAQWHLENREPDGTRQGVDINARAAWPFSLGEGVIVAVADDGIEMDHPDLASRLAGAPHFHFGDGSTNAVPEVSNDRHAMPVAGLIAAEQNNNRGMSGVAPRAKLASWKIFSAGQLLVDEEQLMDVFQYKSNAVSVQNHSWSLAATQQLPLDLLADIGVSNAVHFGREGKGVVLVRSAGNRRGQPRFGNANDDGMIQDPRHIAVAAVRADGRVAGYSNPGACLLVAAPSGDTGWPTLCSTDRQGTNGYNFPFYPDSDYGDYVCLGSGFRGTSGSAPIVAGIVALMLSANPELTWRDVQQILIHSARHWDLEDPGVKSNGAGFLFSHNVGFGVPDAGEAVRLAKNWINRPPRSSVSVAADHTVPIPDDGLRVMVRGQEVPELLNSIPSTSGLGVYPHQRLGPFEIVDVGLATNVITQDLAGKAALIQRGIADFSVKIAFAAEAGAELAIIYNNIGTNERLTMLQTDWSRVPAVFIGREAGEALRDLAAADSSVRVEIEPQIAAYEFSVAGTLICEHVAVRVQTDHPRRSDLRITLISPRGTRSVLQQVNNDSSALTDWTYYSTQHFYEGSAGIWRIEAIDDEPGNTGNLLAATLTIYGVPITDTDGDGLDDDWEMLHFGSLDFGPKDDPDADGYQNAREQILGTNPLEPNEPLELYLSRWNDSVARLSWAASPDFDYTIRTGETLDELNSATNLPGEFPRMEWFFPYDEAPSQFFRIEASPKD